MSRYKVEKDFMVDEFRCVIVGQKIGHRCGYIAIPKGHKLYGKDYDEIDISVHGGLTYAGATVGQFFDGDTERTVLLIGMVELMLGNVGKVFMGLAVALACLTTSTGLTSTCGNYFSTITDGKLKYKHVITATVTTCLYYN